MSQADDLCIAGLTARTALSVSRALGGERPPSWVSPSQELTSSWSRIGWATLAQRVTNNALLAWLEPLETRIALDIDGTEAVVQRIAQLNQDPVVRHLVARLGWGGQNGFRLAEAAWTTGDMAVAAEAERTAKETLERTKFPSFVLAAHCAIGLVGGVET